MKLPANTGNRATSSAAAPRYPSGHGAWCGVEAAEGGFDPLPIAAPHQHGGSDHHEHDHRAPQREPAPGVEQVVQRPGDAAVGEDRPDELLQHAGEPSGDEPAGERSPDAVSELVKQRALTQRCAQGEEQGNAEPTDSW